METLSRPEVLTLFSILEGELEARDLVIDALKSTLNMETLSRPEVLTLFSILEGELEARDLVIDALKGLSQWKNTWLLLGPVVALVSSARWHPSYVPVRRESLRIVAA
ncbi:hypothetical protein CRUP_029534 [Coryphaenoides rupestris]|nr:hypothetical protein CRUP_029534 [Coryphaenoides rupestris]